MRVRRVEVRLQADRRAMCVSIRIVILHVDGQHVGQIAFRNLLLMILLDGIIKFVQSQFIAPVIGIQELLALLPRQIRSLRVASAMLRKR